MKKLIYLLLIVILAFVTCQNVSAITIDATPQQQEFGPNDWIKVNLLIHGYNGGPIKWTAHRPDNSIISGTLDTGIKAGAILHQIVRNAFDNEFGTWSINYMYGDYNQTVHFKVNSLNLAVFTDKVQYNEPDIMKINITTSYYIPQAKFAPIFYLNFYDRDGKTVFVKEIEIKSTQSNTEYDFPMIQLARYNPPGLYNLKIQYFNSTVNVPFLLGDIRKLMELTIESKSTSYYPGDDVILDLLVTRVKESTGIITITDPTGNTTSIQFPVNAVHNKLSLKDITKKIGVYKFDIQYAGVKNTGTFKVIANNNELPKIDLDMYLNKWNYRKGEIVEARVYTSDIIANSIDSWTTDPQGVSHGMISIPVSLNDVIVPHKIAKNDQVGKWQFYIKYGGIVRSSTFYVGGETMEDSELLNSEQFAVPRYPSNISSGLSSPTGIAIDSDNNIYVADSGNSQIKKFDPKGKLLFTLGSIGSSKGEFIHPLGIFVNEKYVYVLDTGNSRIQMFDKNGNFIYSWGKYGDQQGMFHTPVSMSSDKYGNLFVVDSEQNVIQIFDPLGNYKDEISPVLAEGEDIGGAGFKAITFDSKNNFYIISTNNKILKYSSIGKFINFYGSNGTEDGRFNQPSAIAIDTKDYVYVADPGAHRIQKFDSNGNFILGWGSSVDGDDEIDAPTGLAIDALNNIYVVDRNQGTIQKFTSNVVVLPNWIKKNSVWWSEGALDKSDFALAVKYIIKQGLIQIPPTSEYYSIQGNSSALVDQLKKDMQLWSSGEIDHIQSPSENSVKVPEWVKKNVQLWSSGEIDDQTFFRSIEYLLVTGIMKI
ncbi:MAG: hypothetical protein KGI10_08075 [Thaumarchaeota archaeon]|nr:hypothetical protein [Nitrososphaerota archaeon]